MSSLPRRNPVPGNHFPRAISHAGLNSASIMNLVRNYADDNSHAFIQFLQVLKGGEVLIYDRIDPFVSIMSTSRFTQRIGIQHMRPDWGASPLAGEGCLEPRVRWPELVAVVWRMGPSGSHGSRPRRKQFHTLSRTDNTVGQGRRMSRGVCVTRTEQRQPIARVSDRLTVSEFQSWLINNFEVIEHMKVTHFTLLCNPLLRRLHPKVKNFCLVGPLVHHVSPLEQ